MPSISQYFNPCSREFHTCRDFKTLTLGQRMGVVVLTALAAICSIGLLSLAVSRLLVTRFANWNIRDLPQTSLKTHILAQQVIVTKESQTSKEHDNLQKNEPLQKKPEPPPVVPILLNEEPLNTPIILPQAKPIEIPPTATSKLSAKNLFYNSIGYIDRKTHKSPQLPPSMDMKRMLIQSRLNSLGKLMGDAIGNADCLMHAFCQVINVNQKQNLNVENLRFQHSRTILAFSDFSRTWLDDWFDANKGKVKETIQDFASKIQFSGTSQEPIWSFTQREGRILSALFNVNLRVYRGDISGLDDEKAKSLQKDPAAFMELINPQSPCMGPDICAFYVDQKDSVIIPGATETVEIVAYPYSKNRDMFLPVFDIYKVTL